MDHDYKVDFVTVYGFDFSAAALDLGVSLSTILRWYEQSPTPLAKRLLRIMARGYLPDHLPFRDWRVVGTDIHTNFGVVSAFEVEYLNRYKWNARELASRFRNLPAVHAELESRMRKIVDEAAFIQLAISRMNG